MKHRCPDCGGLFEPSGFYHTKGRRDCYCRACRKRRVRESTSPAQRKAAKDRYVDRHGREKINDDERRRRNKHWAGLASGIQSGLRSE